MKSAAVTASPRPLPLIPSDLPRDKILVRAVLAHAVAAGRPGFGHKAADIARQFWPRDSATFELVTRAASSPATTTTSGWASDLAGFATAAFLGSLQNNAAAELLNRAPRFNLAGISHVNLPRASAAGASQWVVEGAAAPVAQGITVGPALTVKKLSIIEGLSRELAEGNPENGEVIVGQILSDSAKHQLDTSLFSNTAGSAAQPPGLTNGVTALTASTATGLAAAVADARAIIDAIVAQGGDGTGVLFFGSPGRCAALAAYMPALADRIFGSSAIASGTLIGCDPNSFASSTGGDPEIRAVLETTLFYEDTTPGPISTPGTPNVISAPVREAFQQDLIVVRCTLKIGWVLRVAGGAQWINTGMTW
jgi:hypothetical protein